jgi:hypothetical protein
MPEPISAPDSFAPLRPGEWRLVSTLHQKEDGASIVLAPTPGPRFGLRGPFLRWYLAKAIPDTKQPVTRIELEGFVVDGPLDLSGCKLAMRAVFARCHFTEPVDLTGAEVPGIAFLGSDLPALLADRAMVKGSLLIRTGDQVPRPCEIAGVVSLNGATIQGNLEMDNTTVRGAPHSGGDHLAIEADGLALGGNLLLRNGFHSHSEIRINGAKIARNVDCSGAILENPGGYTLSAAGAQISGTLYLGSNDPHQPQGQPQFISRGAVRLDGASITGDLNCSNAHFVATAFHNPAWSPTGASRHDVYAITANGLHVGADANLTGRFHSRGTLSFINARIGNDLKCGGAHFDSPGGEAFCGDGMTVGGTVFLTTADGGDPFRTSGVLRFVLAKVSQGFYVRGATFNATGARPAWLADTELLVRDFGGPACGLLASEADVGGAFEWKSVTAARAAHSYAFRMDVSAAHADSVDDDLASWMQLDRFDVNDCEYRSVIRLFDRDTSDAWVPDLRAYVSARLQLLDCEYAVYNRGSRSFTARHGMQPPALHHLDGNGLAEREAVDRFKPQPYMQFARVLRRFGLDAAAEDVLVHLEKNRTRYSGYGPLRCAWRRCLQIGLRYGYSTWRPVAILAVWALLSAFVFESTYSAGHIIPTGGNVTPPPNSHPRVQFNAAVFAVDTLVPIVDLNQKKNWVVDPLSRSWDQGRDRKLGLVSSWYPLWRTAPDRPAAMLVIFNTFFGWLLTTLFATGVSGFLRRGRDG